MRQIGVGTYVATELEREYVNDVLTTGRLSYGPYSRRLEQEMAGIHQREHGVLSNSGTSSLQVALQALAIENDYGPETEVLVPAVTFVATANIVLHNGFKPVPVEIEPETYGMDYDAMLEALTPETRCIIPVNLFGQPARDLSRIYETAKSLGINVIEDSCECMFAKHDGQMVGTWSDISCFSFYVAHLLTTGVGGIGLTDSPYLAGLMRSLVNHGRDLSYISIDDDDVSNQAAREEIIKRRFRFNLIGHSYRITEFEAAVGCAQITTWREMIKRRQANAKILSSMLERYNDRLALPLTHELNTHSFMMYPIVMRAEEKWGLVQHLEKAGIETRELVPLLQQPCYSDLGWNPDDFPVASWLDRSGFYVGIHQDLNEFDLMRIAFAIGEYFS